jgi:hypothetical protein
VLLVKAPRPGDEVKRHQGDARFIVAENHRLAQQRVINADRRARLQAAGHGCARGRRDVNGCGA